mmetsp:Transcript_32504/g.72290  ORF Transcript_32504/g.72290 Transcript_32504/m.72290 type:complete len:392 (+) Transcript_32504:74-1249(+)
MIVEGMGLENITNVLMNCTIAMIASAPHDVPSARNWLSWVFGGIVTGLKVLSAWSVLCMVPGTLYLDLVCWIMKLRPRNPGDDCSWWSQAFTVWLLLLYPQAGFWHQLLASPPMAVSTARFQLFFLAHSILVRCLFSNSRRRELVGDQVLQYLTQPNEEDMEFRSALRDLGLWFCVDMAVIYMEWHDLVEYVPFSLHGTPYLPVALMVWQMWVYARNLTRLFSRQGLSPSPWTTSLRPICPHASGDDDCPVHETCRICLEDLCWPGPGEATVVIAGGCASGHSLSVCRARGRPRSASPGISAARTGAITTAGHMAEPVAGAIDRGQQLATLRCGHTFHVECISAWRRKGGISASCPACRASLQESTVEARDVGLFYVGGFAMLFMLLRPAS